MSVESLTVASSSTWLPSVRVSLFSYGHANGPIVQQHSQARCHKNLSYNIRHLPNPPRHLRANATGLSRRLQKEFLQNDSVEAFLIKIQSELLDAVKTERDQLLCSSEQTAQQSKEVHENSDRNAHASEEATLEDPDIDVVVTICCEEGRHRSVAFVEELARRLTLFKHEDDLSRCWKLYVNVTHRDIGDLKDLEQSTGQQRRPNKAQAKSRQRERRVKGDRYGLHIEGDDGDCSS